MSDGSTLAKLAPLEPPGPIASEPLPRSFGVWSGVFITFASMVGLGILTTSGYIIQETESPSTLLLLWIVGALISLCGALTFAELATLLPHAGGDYRFVSEAFGSGVGFAYGWATFLFGFAAPTALAAQAVVEYLSVPVRRRLIADGSQWPNWASPVGATIIVAVLAVLHCYGRTSSRRAQNALTLLKFVLYALFVVAGLLFGMGQWTNLLHGRSVGSQSFAALTGAMLYVFYGYSGWNASTLVAGEISQPARNIPRAILGGCGMVAALYLVMNLLYIFSLGPAGLQGASHNEVDAIAETSARAMFGSRISESWGVFIGVSLFASLGAYLLTGSRLCYAMARDGLFFRYAKALSPTTLIPSAAVLTQAFAAIAFLWGSFAIAGAADAFKGLLGYTSLALILLTDLAVLSLFMLRWQGRRSPGFAVPWYPLPPLIFIAFSAAIVIWQAISHPTGTLLSIVTVCSGWPIYLGYKRLTPSKDSTPSVRR